MGTVLGIVVFVILLAVTVGWHELGHLLPAKLFGVKVRQYMVGFGPTLWSTTKGETEYGIKGIPLGGYIRMMGMYRPDAIKPKPAKHWAGRVIAETREFSAEEIGEDDPKRAFYRLSWPKKLVVMLGGPTMNLILAVVVLIIVVCGVGIPTPTTTVSSVSSCITTAAECTPTDPKAPAAAAGIQAGDKIIAWNGQSVSTWNELTQAIRSGGSGDATVVVERDGQQQTLTLSPVMAERAVLDADGNQVTGADGKVEMTKVPVVGITPTSTMQGQSISKVPGELGAMIGGTVGVIAKLPVELWNLVSDLVNGQPRDPSGPLGIVGVARLTGDVGEYASSIGWRNVIGTWLQILASLNVALWAFNMLPLLPLDGGHIVGALWEGIRGWWAKLRRKPNPGAADTARMMPFAYVVIGVFAVMTVILVVADIVNPVKLSG